MCVWGGGGGGGKGVKGANKHIAVIIVCFVVVVFGEGSLCSNKLHSTSVEGGDGCTSSPLLQFMVQKVVQAALYFSSWCRRLYKLPSTSVHGADGCTSCPLLQFMVQKVVQAASSPNIK